MMMSAFKKNIEFQEIFINLCNFWNNFGCTLIPQAQTEISSPLFHPTSFFAMIGNKDIDIMYLQPYVPIMNNSGKRYNTQVYSFLKFQVILKSEIQMPQKVFLESLTTFGIQYKNSNIIFKNVVSDNFVFRLNAVGYKVFLNNISIGAIYYIQNIGCSNLQSVPVAISYNIDKILTILQSRDNTQQDIWNNNGISIIYNDAMLFLKNENEDFLANDSINSLILKELENYREMANSFIESDIILPGYISLLKAKYCLDILSNKNYIVFNNKIIYNKSLRKLLDLCCEKYNRNKK